MSDDVIAGFAYPPPAIVPFLWLSRWPLGTALVAFTITSYLVLFASLQQWIAYLKRSGLRVDRNTTIAIMLIALAAGPTYMNAVFGQVNAFVLATAVAFVCLAPTRVCRGRRAAGAGDLAEDLSDRARGDRALGSQDVARAGLGRCCPRRASVC